MTEAEVIDLLALVEQLWPGRRSSGDPMAQVRTWAWRLAELPAAAVLAALRSITSPHPPSAPELAGIAETIVHSQRTLDADQALGVLEQAIHRTGRYRTPTWHDDRMAALVRALGGWQEVCSMEPRWLRKDVAAVWPTICEREQRAEAALAVGLDLANVLKQLPEG